MLAFHPILRKKSVVSETTCSNHFLKLLVNEQTTASHRISILGGVMNAKQATSKLRLPIVWVLSGCALALLAATALYLGTGAGSGQHRAEVTRELYRGV